MMRWEADSNLKWEVKKIEGMGALSGSGVKKCTVIMIIENPCRRAAERLAESAIGKMTTFPSGAADLFQWNGTDEALWLVPRKLDFGDGHGSTASYGPCKVLDTNRAIACTGFCSRDPLAIIET